MTNQSTTVFQYIKESSDLFWELQKKHGDYFLWMYKRAIKDSFIALFSKMGMQELREMAYSPDNYFGSPMRAELRKRKAKAELLRARGRLCGKEGQVCLA